MLPLAYIWVSLALWPIFNSLHGLSEHHENEYINMSHKGVAVHVIVGLKQWVYSAFRDTVAVVWYWATLTNNLLIIGDVFSGNLKEELGTV